MRAGKTNRAGRGPVDLNLDAGEDAEALASGREARLYRLVRRVSIACGGHAGDLTSMATALRLARDAGALAGAHPSYPERAGFGRVALAVAPGDVARFVAEQVGALHELARREGVRLHHVKPHGALYNQCAGDEALAREIAEGVRAVDPSLALVGLAGSRALDVWRSAGHAVLGEAFADRRYRADGTLVPRSEKGAVLAEPEEVVRQVRALVRDGRVQAATGEWVAVACETLCVHGDNPRAEALLEALRAAL